MKKVAIEGILGAGKSYYLNKLAEEGWPVSPQTSNAEWTQRFRNDPINNASNYHLRLLADLTPSTLPALGSAVQKGFLLYERSPFTLRKIYEPLLIQEGIIDSLSAQLHYDLASKNPTHNWVPDVVIYLYCDPDICHERLVNTSGSGDGSGLHPKINPLFLTHLYEAHERLFDEVNWSGLIYKVNVQECPDAVYKNLKDIVMHL